MLADDRLEDNVLFVACVNEAFDLIEELLQSETTDPSAHNYAALHYALMLQSNRLICLFERSNRIPSIVFFELTTELLAEEGNSKSVSFQFLLQKRGEYLRQVEQKLAPAASANADVLVDYDDADCSIDKEYLRRFWAAFEPSYVAVDFCGTSCGDSGSVSARSQYVKNTARHLVVQMMQCRRTPSMCAYLVTAAKLSASDFSNATASQNQNFCKTFAQYYDGLSYSASGAEKQALQPLAKLMTELTILDWHSAHFDEMMMCQQALPPSPPPLSSAKQSESDNCPPQHTFAQQIYNRDRKCMLTDALRAQRLQQLETIANEGVLQSCEQNSAPTTAELAPPINKNISNADCLLFVPQFTIDDDDDTDGNGGDDNGDDDKVQQETVAENDPFRTTFDGVRSMPDGYVAGEPGYADCCPSSFCVLGSECKASVARLVECGIIQHRHSAQQCTARRLQNQERSILAEADKELRKMEQAHQQQDSDDNNMSKVIDGHHNDDVGVEESNDCVQSDTDRLEYVEENISDWLKYVAEEQQYLQSSVDSERLTQLFLTLVRVQSLIRKFQACLAQSFLPPYFEISVFFTASNVVFDALRTKQIDDLRPNVVQFFARYVDDALMRFEKK